MTKRNLFFNIVIFISIGFLVLIPIENANTVNPNLESSSDAVYQNPTNNGVQDVITNFGLLIVALLITVLAKTFFDYIRIRNQSILISN